MSTASDWARWWSSLKRAVEQRAALRLVVTSPQIEKVLKITGLFNVFDIYSDQAAVKGRPYLPPQRRGSIKVMKSGIAVALVRRTRSLDRLCIAVGVRWLHSRLHLEPPPCRPATCPRPTGPIPVGEYASMTGDTATFGQSSHKGIALAVDEINAAGGVNGRQIELHTEDDQSQASEAATAVQKLIDRDQVSGRAGRGRQRQQHGRGADLPGEAGADDLSGLHQPQGHRRMGDYIFRVCFIDPFQGTVMAKFAAQQSQAEARGDPQGRRRSDYSTGLAASSSGAFTELGGQIVADESLRARRHRFQGAADLDQGDRTRRPSSSPATTTEVGTIAPQAQSSGIKVPLLGGDGWDSPKLFEVGGRRAGGLLLQRPLLGRGDRARRSRSSSEVQGQEQRRGAGRAWPRWATTRRRILADAMKRAKSLSGPDLRDAIAATKDFRASPGRSPSTTSDAAIARSSRRRRIADVTRS